MNEKLILYRGDSEKIHSFSFRKTSKDCLFGQGIYLTDSLRVANSYRDKGNYSMTGFANNRVFFSGRAENRPDAYEKGFCAFIRDIYVRDFDPHLFDGCWKPKDRQAVLKKAEAKIRSIYQSCIEDGKITSSYCNKYENIPDKTKRSGYRYESYTAIELTYHPDKFTGYVTEFAFDKKPFLDSIIYADTNRSIEDKQVLEIAKEHDILDMFDVTDDYRGQRVNLKTKISDNEFYAKVRRIYSDYGYLGLQYSGGRIIGGLGHHNAYVIWDEDYINQHKQRRTKNKTF